MSGRVQKETGGSSKGDKGFASRNLSVHTSRSAYSRPSSWLWVTAKTLRTWATSPHSTDPKAYPAWSLCGRGDQGYRYP